MIKKWKYAISFAEEAPMTAPLPLVGDLYENMQIAHELGYQALEFHTREFYEFDYERIENARRNGIGDICMIVTGRLYTQGHHGLLDKDENSVEQCIEGLKTYIDKAAILKAGIVIGWVKGVVAPNDSKEEALKLLGERMVILDRYAALKGVDIHLEVINRYETNIFNTAAETLAFIEHYDLDHCYVHLDTFHMNIEESNPYDAIRLCGKQLGYFHIADNNRHYPGSGQINFCKILESLLDIGYDKWITLECQPIPDRYTAATRGIAHIKDCEKKLGLL